MKTFKVGDRVKLKPTELALGGHVATRTIYTMDGYDPNASSCIFLKEVMANDARRPAWFDWRFELAEEAMIDDVKTDYTSDELWSTPA